MYCKYCGAPLENGTIFCSACGKRVGEQTADQTNGQGTHYQGNPNGQQNANGFSDTFQNTTDTTGAYEPGDISAHTGLAVLAYFGPLVLIPICVAQKSPYARFHCNQGLVLLIIEIIYSVLCKFVDFLFGDFWIFGWLLRGGFALIGILIFVLFIIGVVNAAGGKAKELPIIGKIRIYN